ncbi:amidase [Rhodoferax sp. PAMC 29310]|uniref:amidase n=1 Tax=Rhodoferax sp. PAMC 29310 TaxID=2822760 RepID=UPI001B326AB0|nr:amidase [Rhodoferax sp. PAMC 29310]
MRPDLTETRQRLLAGQSSPEAEIQEAIDIASSACCERAFLTPTWHQAREAASTPGVANTPLAGLAVSIKDMFDVKGQNTHAGSLALKDAPVARQDSAAVSRLRRAGAALLGRTNMSEFAFSGVGINPHFGTPANVASTAFPRVPGGSSSGAAVSVATGAAFIGLGSDTGGSIRIPAALNGIVGFKNTARLVPTTGAVPLAPSLDTICALTRSVRDAVLAHEILAHRRVIRSPAPLASYRLAVANHLMQDGMDTTVARAFERTLQHLREAGASIQMIQLNELSELTSLQANGGLPAAESYQWHRHLLEKHADHYDPRVAARIQRGAVMSACDYLDLQHARAAWIERMSSAMTGFDAVLSPTVPIVAPLLAEVAPGEARDNAFFHLNSLLLRNPSAINMLDGCAISLPCHTLGELPVGLMVWAGAMRDDVVLNVALQVEKTLQKL